MRGLGCRVAFNSGLNAFRFRVEVPETLEPSGLRRGAQGLGTEGCRVLELRPKATRKGFASWFLGLTDIVGAHITMNVILEVPYTILILIERHDNNVGFEILHHFRTMQH